MEDDDLAVKQKEGSVMVFYFTATGNSLYIAKKIDKNPISISKAIHGDTNFTDKKIGIVCPIFAGQPPKIVLDFMRKASFKTDYFFMVLTYGMNDSDAAEYTKKLGKKIGLQIDYIRTIQMVDNYLPAFDMDEEMAIDKKIEEQIPAILEEINNRASIIPIASKKARRLHKMVSLINRIIPRFNNGKQIKITDACTGCGICTKVCPTCNFYIENGKSKRRKKTCEFCLACAQNCPHKAIALRYSDKNPNARYRNENIALQEIIDANNQTRCAELLRNC